MKVIFSDLNLSFVEMREVALLNDGRICHNAKRVIVGNAKSTDFPEVTSNEINSYAKNLCTSSKEEVVVEDYYYCSIIARGYFDRYRTYFYNGESKAYEARYDKYYYKFEERNNAYSLSQGSMKVKTDNNCEANVKAYLTRPVTINY